MKAAKAWQKILKILSNFFVFFLMVAFVVTCTTMLFVSTLSDSLGIEMSADIISFSAKTTFINVFFISMIFTIFDSVRRALTVERSAKHIAAAAERIVAGDLDARVESIGRFGMDECLLEITDCFNKMAEELSGVETLRTDFIANVSHEIKTPLAVMQNYSTMLQQPGLPEPKRMEYAKVISEASRRLAELISNILKLNKLESRQIYPASKAFDLTGQLTDCLLQFESLWEEKNINIDVQLDDTVIIQSDEELLSLVWNNLLSNAFKFTSPGGTVSLSIKEDDDYVTVSISDTGCGISPEVGKHIFEKFYQGDSSRASQGNGLGLALVKRVVDITQSEIQVKSVPGKGTCFSVKLRRQKDADN